MPSVEPLALTDAERLRAQGSLASIASLPREQLRGALRQLPGMESHVEDFITAVGEMPSEAWPMLVTTLPADMVRAMTGEAGG
jgi:hypothetical protein